MQNEAQLLDDGQLMVYNNNNNNRNGEIGMEWKEGKKTGEKERGQKIRILCKFF